MRTLVVVLVGCAAGPTGQPSAPPGVAPTGPLDGTFQFRQLNTGVHTIPAFRHDFTLAIAGTTATLEIVTGFADAAKTTAELEHATFTPRRTLAWHGTARVDPQTHMLVLELISSDSEPKLEWWCERVTTHVFAAGAHAVRAPTDDRCETAAPVEPAARTTIGVLSCREPAQANTGDPADPVFERHRDANRWTFTPAPSLELVGDTCPLLDGVLRRAR